MYSFKILYKSLALLTLLWGAFACHQEYENHPQEAVVRVYDKTLSREEVNSVIPLGSSSQDSLKIANAYIKEWIKETLIAEKARLNVPPNEPTIEAKVAAYRQSLLIQYYEQQLLNQKADLTPSDEEIQSFYNQHKAGYQLKENLLRGIFLKLSNDAPKINEVKKLMSSNDEEDYLKLEDYCLQNAKAFDDFREVWKPESLIIKAHPNRKDNTSYSFNKEQLYESSDSLYVYLLNVTEITPQTTPAPLEYIKERIIKILKQQKKLEFIDTFEREILFDAVQNKQVEYYIGNDAKYKN